MFTRRKRVKDPRTTRDVWSTSKLHSVFSLKETMLGFKRRDMERILDVEKENCLYKNIFSAEWDGKKKGGLAWATRKHEMIGKSRVLPWVDGRSSSFYRRGHLYCCLQKMFPCVLFLYFCKTRSLFHWTNKWELKSGARKKCEWRIDFSS